MANHKVNVFLYDQREDTDDSVALDCVVDSIVDAASDLGFEKSPRDSREFHFDSEDTGNLDCFIARVRRIEAEFEDVRIYVQACLDFSITADRMIKDMARMPSIPYLYSDEDSLYS